MKRIIRTLLAFASATIMTVSSLGCASTKLHIMNATVVATYDDVVIVETLDGNVWTFFGTGFEAAHNVMIATQNGAIIDAAIIG